MLKRLRALNMTCCSAGSAEQLGVFAEHGGDVLLRCATALARRQSFAMGH
jgi:hypothetical protein